MCDMNNASIQREQKATPNEGFVYLLLSAWRNNSSQRESDCHLMEIKPKKKRYNNNK